VSKTAVGPDLEPDGAIAMTTAGDAEAERNALLRWVWGQPELPRALPARVIRDVPPCGGRSTVDCNPLGLIRNLRRVDNLIVDMELSERSLAHHFIPVSGNRRLVIVHKGHGCDFGDSKGGDNDYGEVNAIESLVAAGFSVLGMYMPRLQPGNCDTSRDANGYSVHDHMFKTFRVASGSVVKFFVEPIAVNLNYLKTRSASDQFPVYLSYDMMGLSGGGWTTTFYAALDPTIEISIPIGGTLPLYMRRCANRADLPMPPANCNWGYDGDSEQTFPDTYNIAGYLDLYALGTQGGANRRQIQVLNRRDDCCFGEEQFAGPGSGSGAWDQAVQDYEKIVNAAPGTVPSAFHVVIDEKSVKHEISRSSVADLILPVFSRATGNQHVRAATAGPLSSSAAEPLRTPHRSTRLWD
jgi:hypothetical protein